MSDQKNIKSSRVSSPNKKKQLRLLLAIFVALIILVVLFVVFMFSCGSDSCFSGEKTDKVGDVPADNISPVEDQETPVFNPSVNSNPEENLAGAIPAPSGANLVTTGGQVINEAGVPVRNTAAPMTAEAPRLSAPLDKNALPTATIKIEATASGFKPASFTVSVNQPVTLALTSSGVDSRLVFSDPGLSALEIPVPSSYTMAKTFNAPSTPGQYSFYQDIPGRRGETGVMIVE